MMEHALPQKLKHYLPPKKHAVGKASTFNLCEVIFCGHLNNKLIKVQS